LCANLVRLTALLLSLQKKTLLEELLPWNNFSELSTTYRSIEWWGRLHFSLQLPYFVFL